jgi:hypothetical protein
MVRSKARCPRVSVLRCAAWAATLAVLVGARSADAQTPGSPMVAPLDVTTADVKAPPWRCPASRRPPARTAARRPRRRRWAAACSSRGTPEAAARPGCAATLCGGEGCGEGGASRAAAACTTCEGQGRFGRPLLRLPQRPLLSRPLLRAALEHRGQRASSWIRPPDDDHPLPLGPRVGMTTPTAASSSGRRPAPRRGRPLNETRCRFRRAEPVPRVRGRRSRVLHPDALPQHERASRTGGSGGFGDLVLGTSRCSSTANS